MEYKMSRFIIKNKKVTTAIWSIAAIYFYAGFIVAGIYGFPLNSDNKWFSVVIYILWLAVAITYTIKAIVESKKIKGV